MHFRVCSYSVMVMIFLLGIRGTCTAEADSEKTAKEILQSTGVTGGLIVHVGWGGGKGQAGALTAALRTHKGIVVQGLAEKPSDVTHARAYVDSRGLYGPVSIDRWNGKDLPYSSTVWRSESVTIRKQFSPEFSPTLVVSNNVVVITGGNKQATALSAKDGSRLWSEEHLATGWKAPDAVFVAEDVVWSAGVGDGVKGDKVGLFVGRDLLTGEVKQQFNPDFRAGFHHRCHGIKATRRYFLTGYDLEFVDPKAESCTGFSWVRGSCIYGIMPANGMIYSPQDPCQCGRPTKLSGFYALSPVSQLAKPGTKRADSERLETGSPAGNIPETMLPNAGDWPTYRHDAMRSGFSDCTIPDSVKEQWRVDVGGTPSAPVIAAGRVFLAVRDRHAIHVLDADSGKKLWSYTTGGPIDSPPTISGGLCVFGCADGWVYALRVADGSLAWRFRVAPADRRIFSFEQLESLWPVHGSVLVLDGVVYCAAGRSVFLDGGLRFLKLDLKTGKMMSEKIIDYTYSANAGKRRAKKDECVLPDILSSDGTRLFMRTQEYDLDWKTVRDETRRIHAPGGFLDDEYWHRTYWVYGRGSSPGGRLFIKEGGRPVPVGRLLVHNKSDVYGFGRKQYILDRPAPLEYELYRTGRDEIETVGTKKYPMLKRLWESKIPLHVFSMVLTKGKVFVAGTPDLMDEIPVFARLTRNKLPEEIYEQEAVLANGKGAMLWATSCEGGEKLAEYRLDAVPVFDGMAAAHGKLFICMKDGTVRCFGE